MAYDIKITDLINKKELVDAGTAENRLFKFSLNSHPDGFWVLLMQRAGLAFTDVTLSASADQGELWASAAGTISIKAVLNTAKKAIAQANSDANESEAHFNQAAKDKADALAAAQEAFTAEVEELDFDSDPELV